MADVCRVYGVAELLRRATLHSGEAASQALKISALGHCWIVDGPQVEVSERDAAAIADEIKAPLESQPEPGEDEPPPGWFLARAWNYLYVTSQSKDKTKAVATLRKALPLALRAIAKPEAAGGAEMVTVPQGLETAGGKGSRQASRATYGESQSEMPTDFWAVAAVGAMAVGTFLWPGRGRGQGNVALVPVPEDVNYVNHLEIRDDLRAEGILCPVSTATAVAHFAVKLAIHQARRQAETSQWASRYSAIAYEAMVPTGQRPKPAHGGMFPMDTLNEIIGETQDSAARAESLLSVWDKLFQKAGWTQGLETLALTLTDFLMHPTLRNLERHWRTHLRFSLREEGDKKRVRTFYPEVAMEGLMTHVAL